MLHKTRDTYKASWLMMNGATVIGVYFEQSSKSGRQKYIISLDVPDPKFLMFWNQYRPVGNIRNFASARIGLKRKIYDVYKTKVSPKRM